MGKAISIVGAIVIVAALAVAFFFDRAASAPKTYYRNLKIEFPANNIDGFRIADGVVLRTYRIIRESRGSFFNTVTNRPDEVDCSVLMYSIKNDSYLNFHWGGFAKIHPIRDSSGVLYLPKELSGLQWSLGEDIHNRPAVVPPGATYEAIIPFERIPNGGDHLFLEFDLY